MAGYEDDIIKFLMKKMREQSKNTKKIKPTSVPKRVVKKKPMPKREQLSNMSPEMRKKIAEAMKKSQMNGMSKATKKPRNRVVGSSSKPAPKHKKMTEAQKKSMIRSVNKAMKRFPPEDPPMAGVR